MWLLKIPTFRVLCLCVRPLLCRRQKCSENLRIATLWTDVTFLWDCWLEVHFIQCFVLTRTARLCVRAYVCVCMCVRASVRASSKQLEEHSVQDGKEWQQVTLFQQKLNQNVVVGYESSVCNGVWILRQVYVNFTFGKDFNHKTSLPSLLCS